MTKRQPYISVILPVFRVAKYLEKCIKTLQSQTLENLEFIFVDDCGGDESCEIIEKYAKNDSRIRLIHNEHNKGAGATRNHGIQEATGEYISFADPDDWMNPEFYEILYTEAKAGNYDIVKGDRVDVVYRENGEIRYLKPEQSKAVINAASEGIPLYACFYHGHQAAIYRTSMVKACNAHYSETSFGECGMFILMACCHAKTYSFVNGANYYYLQHQNSAAHSLSWNKYESELKAIFEQMEYAQSVKSNDNHLSTYLRYKLGFLLWRYEELCQEKSLVDKRKIYMDTILEKIKVFSCYNELVLDIKKRQETIFLKRHRILRFAKRVLTAIVRRLQNKIHGNKHQIYDNFTGREICYMQNMRGAVFYTKRFLEIDKKFAKQFLIDFTWGAEKYNQILPIDSPIYKEHAEYAKNNEICWKYIRRLGCISKTIIYIDEEGKLCMRGELIGEQRNCRNHKLLAQPARRIIEGQTLDKYIDAMGTNIEEVVGELRQFLDYVFDRFATQDPDILQGIAFDACPRNCILHPGHKYELFDFEYEYKNLDRGFLIRLAVRHINSKIKDIVYYRLCEIYGLAAKSDYYDTLIQQGWMEIMDNTTDSKYFIK